MKNETLLALAEEIKRIYDEEARLPFPYEGCRTLLRDINDEFEDFIPNLVLYFGNIAGYSCGSTKISNWPAPEMRKAFGNLSLNFFELHPEYAVLQRFISEATTPDLHEDLLLYERLRQNLLTLLKELLSVQETFPQTSNL